MPDCVGQGIECGIAIRAKEKQLCALRDRQTL
jgi:hypothetical protein